MSAEEHSDFALLSRLVDGLLSAGELEQIQERLMVDAEFRHRYVQFLDMDFELSQRLSKEVPAASGHYAPVDAKGVRRRTSSVAGSGMSFLKIAAVLLLGLGAWWIALFFKTSPEEVELTSQPVTGAVPERNSPDIPQPKQTSMVNGPIKADSTEASPIVPAPSVSIVEKESVDRPEISSISPTPKPAQPEVTPFVVGQFCTFNSESGLLELTEEITSGEHEVKDGTVDFRLHTGVRVRVEGPAQFALQSGMKMRLISGRIAAEVFPTATGFQVEANAVSVTDFGTRFAVTANSKGDAAVHVYDGHVRAGTGPEPMFLDTGETVRLDEKTGLLEPIRFDEKLFATKPAWSGNIEWCSDGVEILAKPPRHANRDDLPINHPVIFKERSGLSLRRGVPVNLLATSNDNDELEVPKGRTLSTYCLHGSNPEARISGQIRFDSPILGIIYDSVMLDETDRTLGARRTNYPAGISYRGIEPGDIENKKPITVEEDGRTLRFSFSAPNFDQFRILVAED